MKSLHANSTNPNQWVDLHADALYRFALLRIGKPDVAEELVQETFLAALQAREAFKGRSSERTWLAGILKHKIVDHYRAIKRERPHGNLSEVAGKEGEESFDKNGGWRTPPPAWSEPPQKTLENQEFWNVFHGCLDKLPPRLREAFLFKETDEMDGEEICKLLGVTPTNLWVMLHRAREYLRRCLGTRWFGREEES